MNHTTTTTANAGTAASTTIRILPVDHHDGSPLSAEDPRVPFARSVNTARVVIDALDERNALNSTPCAHWNAHDLAGHLVAVLDRVAALPTGRNIDELPRVRDDVPVADMSEVFMNAAHAVRAAWTDDALETMVTTPWATMPGSIAIAVYTSEILTHTWDLATSIGVEPEWHDGDVELAAAVIRRGLPAEPRGTDEIPFSTVVPTPDDAPAIHRLVAWVGRTPNP